MTAAPFAPPTVRLALVLATALVAGCSIDFNEAVPCENDSQCPAGMGCNAAIGRCESGSSTPADGGADGTGSDAGLDGSPDVPVDLPQDPIADGTGQDAVEDTPVEVVDEGTGDGGCVPGTEVCNGLDDNCNDQVDEGLDCGTCPDAANMALIAREFLASPYCIDLYEASRDDATLASAGTNDAGPATSVRAVQPWTGISQTDAAAACTRAGKRLCTTEEWTEACGGPDAWLYPYNATTFDASSCNGAETPGGAGAVGPTGSRPECESPEGAVDMSGNVEEWIDGTTTRGGAFDDTNVNMRCTGVGETPAGPGPAIGFRCCAAVVE